MNRAHIYSTYIEESITTLNKIYSELLDFSYMSPSQNPSQDSLHKNKSKNTQSIQNIKSLCSTLDRRTKLVGSYLGETSVPVLDYTLEQDSWRTHMYIETTKVVFTNVTLHIEFFLDFPENGKYLICIKDNGVLMNTIFTETPNTVRVITLAPDMKLIYNEELINVIRSDNNLSSTIKIEAPPYFSDSQELLRIRIPFHPERIYLSHIGWVRSILDSMDSLILQIKFCIMQYASTLVATASGVSESDESSGHIASSFASTYYQPRQTTTAFAYKP